MARRRTTRCCRRRQLRAAPVLLGEPLVEGHSLLFDSPDEHVEPDVLARQVGPRRQVGLEQEHGGVAVSEDGALQRHLDVPRARQRLDPLVRVAWMRDDLVVLLEPPVDHAGLPAHDDPVADRRVVADPRRVLDHPVLDHDVVPLHDRALGRVERAAGRRRLRRPEQVGAYVVAPEGVSRHREPLLPEQESVAGVDDRRLADVPPDPLVGGLGSDAHPGSVARSRQCPGWDSNPHWTVFETASSAVGIPGRQHRKP